MSRVSVVSSMDRQKAVTEALNEIRPDIEKNKIKDKSVLIKPNLVSTSRLLAVTHVDAVRGVIDFIKDFEPKKIIIAEGTGGTFKAYENFGYNELVREYENIELVDVNADSFVEIKFLTMEGDEHVVHLSKTVIDADFKFSVARAKTHDHTTCTLTLKNLQGCIPRREQVWTHGAPREFHGEPPELSTKSNNILARNIATIVKKIKPDVGVIDGIVAMEGDGPGGGDPVDLGVVVASSDVLAADTVMAEVMGFDSKEIGYIYYADKIGLGEGKIENIEVLGERIENVRRKFKPHRNYYESQVIWREYMGNIMDV